MTDIQALFDEMKRASTALGVVEKEKREALEASKNRVHERFADRLEKARSALGAAATAHAKALEAEASTNPLVGRKVIRPAKKKTSRWDDAEPEVRGVIEVYRRGDPFHRSYGFPAPGSLIIRHLKKDGSPAVRATEMRLNSTLPGAWQFVEETK